MEFSWFFILGRRQRCARRFGLFYHSVQGRRLLLQYVENTEQVWFSSVTVSLCPLHVLLHLTIWFPWTHVSKTKKNFISIIGYIRVAEINVSTTHPALPQGPPANGPCTVVSSTSSRSTRHHTFFSEANVTGQHHNKVPAANHPFAHSGTYKRKAHFQFMCFPFRHALCQNSCRLFPVQHINPANTPHTCLWTKWTMIYKGRL